jgi:hypothetical protein
MNDTRLLNPWTCRFAVAGLTLMTLSLMAQDAQNLQNSDGISAPTEGPTAAKTPPTSVSSGLAEQFNSGVANGGTMSITRFNAGVAVPVRLSDDLVLSTSFRYGLDSYDFRGLQPQWRGAWHNIDTYTLATVLQGRIDDQWSVYGGGLVRESGESGAEFDQGFTGGGVLGVNYKYSDTLSFGGGLGGMNQLEEGPAVLPLLTADWKFADDWCLKLGLTDVATIGYGAQVIYNLSKDWDLSAGFQHEKSRFRIEGVKYPIVVFPPGRVYGPSINGVGQEESSALYTDATWHATDSVDVDAYLGLTVGGNIRMENKTGAEMNSSDYNTAAVLGVRASLRF